jgi:predicted transcriptional regulator
MGGGNLQTSKIKKVIFEKDNLAPLEREVIKLLKKYPNGITCKKLAEKLFRKESATETLLWRMTKQGLLKQIKSEIKWIKGDRI